MYRVHQKINLKDFNRNFSTFNKNNNESLYLINTERFGTDFLVHAKYTKISSEQFGLRSYYKILNYGSINKIRYAGLQNMYIFNIRCSIFIKKPSIMIKLKPLISVSSVGMEPRL